MFDIKIIKERLAILQPIYLEVHDDRDKHKGHAGYNKLVPSHVSIIIVSTLFNNMRLLDRHKMVYSCLKDELKNGLHAVAINAKAPNEMINYSQ